jgi:hypothetical protein
MKLQTNGYPLAINSQLIAILELELAKSEVDASTGVILNFRDPDYSAESGGFHPVEIAMDRDGKLLYLTDFAYVGAGWNVELAKELDFDFSCGLFQQFGMDYPIAKGRELFDLWQQNFCSYVAMGVFQISVSSL